MLRQPIRAHWHEVNRAPWRCYFGLHLTAPKAILHDRLGWRIVIDECGCGKRVVARSWTGERTVLAP